ncbi:leucine-rich repeat protein, partial [Glaesserella parasuis]|uniref:leucine-rich repeat protein n=1 Tax=Glaesserella parasuis TaxID=738 RepID=UPI002723019A|nr:leucine-rich repeat protein [Glaesserella parasuis]
SLKKIGLKEGMVNIPHSAFVGIPNEVEITIPESVKIIEGYAFAGIKVKDFVIPQNVEAIHNGVFERHQFKAIVTEGHSRAREADVLVLPNRSL